jgi:hypothetical protein
MCRGRPKKVIGGGPPFPLTFFNLSQFDKQLKMNVLGIQCAARLLFAVSFTFNETRPVFSVHSVQYFAFLPTPPKSSLCCIIHG